MFDETGVKPLAHAVLLEPLEYILSTVIAMTDSSIEHEMLSSIKGRVVSVGDMAWNDEKAPRARVGDLVLVTKFAGSLVRSPKNNKVYRMVNDRDIYGLLEDVKASKAGE